MEALGHSWMGFCFLLFRILLLALRLYDSAAQLCGARELHGDAWQQPAESNFAWQEIGFECLGYHHNESCCEAVSMQRVLAHAQQALEHNFAQLDQIGHLLSSTRLLLQTAEAGSLGDCSPVIVELLRPRLDGVMRLEELARGALQATQHLVISGMCAYCFAEQLDAPYRVTMDDGKVARELAGLGCAMEDVYVSIEKATEAIVAGALGWQCSSPYILGLLEGTRVLLDAGEEWRLQLGVEAVSLQRRWPFERRTIALNFGEKMSAEVHNDFLEVTERLMTFAIGPASKVMHQAQSIALAYQIPRSNFRKDPLARIMWGVGDMSRSVLFTVVPASTASAADAEDPGAAFGMIVLISNQTSRQTVDLMMNFVEGPRLLFLEDVCGSALDTLGYGCHKGGVEQSKCLHPVHASHIVASSSKLPLDRRPRVAWRRHGATKSIAHTAWDLAKQYWGPHCTAWLADVRPHSSCPDNTGLSLAEQSRLVNATSLHVVKDPETLFGLGDSQRQNVEASEEQNQQSAAKTVDSISDAQFTAGSFADRLRDYINFHGVGVEALAAAASAGQPPPRDLRMLVYSCQPFSQCGGVGDRINGVSTAFLLAVLTGRLFLVDSDSPLPLQTFLEPNLIDWRVRGSIGALAGLRHHSYHDKRWQFEEDIARLAAYPDPLLIVSKNYRMFRSLFEAPALRAAVESLGLPFSAPSFFAAEVFEILFKPSPVVLVELNLLKSSLGDLEDRRFVSVHLRTGKIATDPDRHGKEELSEFLACAAIAESELKVDADLPWLLATDSAEIAEAVADTPEVHSGKLRVPGAVGRVHIDRSDVDEVLRGSAANYAEWLLFGRAAASILSRSYFGETAAEIGRVERAYFAPGGGCVRVDLTSS